MENSNEKFDIVESIIAKEAKRCHIYPKQLFLSYKNGEYKAVIRLTNEHNCIGYGRTREAAGAAAERSAVIYLCACPTFHDAKGRRAYSF